MCHLLTYIKTKQLEKQKIKQETIVFKKVAINYRSLAFYRILLLNFHINPERIDFPPHFLWMLIIIGIFLLYFIGNEANNCLLHRSPLKSFHQFRKVGGNGGTGGNLNNN